MDAIGKTLKEKRIEKGLTIEDVSDSIKIRRKYLEAIESGNYSEIPDKVYTKSFLKIYAEYLGLDQVYVLKRYLDEVSQEENVLIPTKTVGAQSERNYRNAKDKNNIKFFTFVSVVLALLLLTWITVSLVKRNKVEPTLLNSPTAQEPISSELTTEAPSIQIPPSPPAQEQSPSSPTQVPISPENIEPPDQKPPLSFDKLVLSINTKEKVWVSYTMDDTKKESFTLPAQTTRIIEAERKIFFQIGNAGGLNITINQFELGMIGKSGEVMDLEVILSPGQSIKVNVIANGKIIDTKTYTP
jgi:cytoskeleton protein RodZ